MKIVKYIFLLLLLAGIAITVFIATQEGKYDIRREKVVKVPKPVLYNYINDYHNWENIGIVTDADSTATYNYSGPSSAPGASMKWSKSGADGKVTTVRLKENDSIIQKAEADGLESQIAWGFADAPSGTKVTVRVQGELTFSEKASALLQGGLEKKLEQNLEKGLENLNVFLVQELTTFNVNVTGLVNKTEVHYIGQQAVSGVMDSNQKIQEILPKLYKFIKENKIVTNGKPFTLYGTYDTSANMRRFTVCIPIRDEIFTSPGSDIIGGKLPGFKAVKVTLNGDYSHLSKAWEAGRKYVGENALQENTTGNYVEIYAKNSQQTKRPSKWVTDIYLPVGAPQVPDLIEEGTTSESTTATPRSVPADQGTARPAPGTATPVPSPRRTAPPASQGAPGATTTPAERRSATQP